MVRWFALAVFVAALGISARRRWQARRATGAIAPSQEPPRLIAGRLLVALPLFGSVVTYLANPSWMAWASLSVPAAVRWTGVALGVLTVPAVYWVLTTLGTNVSETVLTKQQHRLVTTGPYRWVRHPLYSTGITLFLSLGLMAANWFILLWVAITLVGVRFVIIPREEGQLVLKFSDEYRRYRLSTGSLLPLWQGARDHGMHSRPSPRDWLIGMLLGSGIGTVLLGIGGRVAMRGIALLSDAAPGFSLGGTITVVLLGAVSGLAGGVVFVGLRWLLPRHRVARALLFWLFLVLVTLRGLRPIDVQRLALFIPLVLTYGLILQVTWCRATRRRRVLASEQLGATDQAAV